MARVQVSVWSLLSMVAVSGVAGLGEPSAAQLASTSPHNRANIRLAPVFSSVFDELLASSPTFRAQCVRIAMAPHVAVAVTPALRKSLISQGRARGTMTRFASGGLHALVEIPVPATMSEYAELFGHELEHIIEQIDDVDLAALTVGQGGARRLYDGAYETRRAQQVGLIVAEEHDRASRTGGMRRLPLRQPASHGASESRLGPVTTGIRDQQ